MAWRSFTGGILWLLDLIRKYPTELSVDFRSLYNLSIFDVDETYSYKEAIHLIAGLSDNTNSYLFCKINGWQYPISQETMSILTLLDNFILANSDHKKKKPKQHPRPWDNIKASNRSSNINDDDATIGKATIDRDKAIEILNKSNPQTN